MGTSIQGANQALEVARQAGVNAVRQSNAASGAFGAKTGKPATVGGLLVTFAARVTTLNRQMQDLQAGVSIAKAADAGLATQQKAVSQIADLAKKAAAPNVTTEDRAKLNAQAQDLLKQVNKTAQETTFNGKALLGDKKTTVAAGGEVQVNVGASTTKSLGLNGIDLTTEEGVAAAQKATQEAANRVDKNRADLTTQEDRFTHAINQRQNSLAANQNAADLIQQVQSNLSSRSGTAAFIQGNVYSPAAAQLLGTNV